jgi:hypothetical protein
MTHYSTILLAGWFLFLPPRIGDSKNPTVDSNKPLSQWEHHMSFDTAKECEEYRQRALNSTAASKTTKIPTDTWIFARCIPSESIQFK